MLGHDQQRSTLETRSHQKVECLRIGARRGARDSLGVSTDPVERAGTHTPFYRRL